MLLVSGCVEHLVPPGPAVTAPRETDDAFVMPDGTRCRTAPGCRTGEPWAVVLALHGMNDSRDAWEYPAPDLAAHGVAVFAPDQRGFGDTADRGYWPGTQALVDDARDDGAAAAPAVSACRLILMGESMGAAVLMCLATAPDPPPADGYVLVAPAVWGRAEMNVFLRGGAVAVRQPGPGFTVTGRWRQGGQRQPRGDQAAVAATR